jgi:hypothetical protein
MFDPIIGCRIERRSFFRRIASVPQFQLELDVFLASNFILWDRSVASVDSLASLRCRLIFSRLTKLSTAAL